MDSQENSTRLSRSIGSNFLNYSKNGNRRKLLLGSQYLYITKTKQKHQKKTLQAKFPDECDSKIINKIFTNRIQTYIREIAHPDQVDFIPQMKVWYNIHKSINVIKHLSELKNKNQIIISMVLKKPLTKSIISS